MGGRYCDARYWVRAMVFVFCAFGTVYPSPTVSPFTSIHFRTMPWPLQIPLSLIPPEYVEISPVARNDLDMTLYVLFGF